jgi:hypothetical protein
MSVAMNAIKQSIKEIVQTLKTEGIKATFKKHGWKAFTLVFFYYLIRDVTLYILIPGLIIAFT